MVCQISIFVTAYAVKKAETLVPDFYEHLEIMISLSYIKMCKYILVVNLKFNSCLGKRHNCGYALHGCYLNFYNTNVFYRK